MASNIRVLLTGGHAGTTALSVVEEIRKRNDTKDWVLFWVGAKRAVEGKNIPTLESQTLPKLGVTSYAISTGRLQRRFTLYTIPSLLKIPVGFLHAIYLLSKIKPDVILSFGGFAAFPIVVVGWLLRIPVIVHEQTAAAGRSNLASQHFARKIALSRSSSTRYFAKEKCVIVGNPVTSDYFKVKPKNKLSNPPVIFVTGGSRGSTPINEVIIKDISGLTESYHIIHQVGPLDFDEVKKAKDMLSAKQKDRYEIYDVVPPQKMSELFERADLIIARAGANTVSQVLIAKRPTLFIPLPFAYNDEQTKNAIYAKEFGIADILPQETLNGDRLEDKITEMLRSWDDMVTNTMTKESPDVEASKKLVNLIKEVL